MDSKELTKALIAALPDTLEELTARLRQVDGWKNIYPEGPSVPVFESREEADFFGGPDRVRCERFQSGKKSIDTPFVCVDCGKGFVWVNRINDPRCSCGGKIVKQERADLRHQAVGRDVPDDVRNMLLHSGRSAFLLTIDNVNADGSISCQIVPTTRATGYEQPLRFLIAAERGAR